MESYKQVLLNFYNQYKLIVFPLGVSLSGVILITFVIYPQINGLLSGQEEYQKATQRFELLDVKADELEQLDESDLKRKMEIALLALPADKDYPAIIGIVQELIGKYGFIIDGLRVGSSVAKSTGSSGFIIDVQMQGPKDVLPQVLKDLETTSQVMKIASIDLSSSPESPNFISANVTIEVYYAGLPSKLGSLDAPLPGLTASDDSLISELIAAQSSLSIISDKQAVLLPRGKANPFE